MDRKILHISSCRENVTEKFAVLLRELGRRTQSPLWGKAFTPEEETKTLLYLDSGGRGNLNMMAKGMGADVTEYIFIDKTTGERYLLLTEMLKSEYKDGGFCYISSKDVGITLGNRVKTIDVLYGIRDFFAVKPTGIEKSPVYSAICSEAKKNIENGFFNEGGMEELFEISDVPSVIICDVFSANGAFAFLKSRFGNPLAIHLMNREKHIYAPFMSLEKEIFIETEEFVKDALFAVSQWLFDSGEERSAKMLNKAFASLSGGEELIERTVRTFIYTKRKRK